MLSYNDESGEIHNVEPQVRYCVFVHDEDNDDLNEIVGHAPLIFKDYADLHRWIYDGRDMASYMDRGLTVVIRKLELLL